MQLDSLMSDSSAVVVEGTGPRGGSELLIDVCVHFLQQVIHEMQIFCSHPILTGRVSYVSGHVLTDGVYVYHHCAACLNLKSSR